MGIVGELLFDISKSREKAQKLAISIEADVRSIEDATNSTIEVINGYLYVKRGPVDSRGKTINEFLLEVREAFEDLKRNAEEQYMELLATVDTTGIDDLRYKVLRPDLGNMAKWMQRLEKMPPKILCTLAATAAVAAITKEVMVYLREMKWKSYSFAGGVIGGALGGPLVFIIMEIISRAVESKMLEKYIEELTQAEQTMRKIRKAIVGVADQLKFALMCIQLQSGNVGYGREFYFGCVSRLVMCITSSKSIKSIPSPPYTSLPAIQQ
jgi:uncharacterized membrane protein